MNDAELTSEKSITIPVIEESISYEVHEQETGKVRITKQVHEETVEVNDTITHERVLVERVPKNQYVDVLPPPVRYEGDVMIVPVLREVVVKRLLLVEEVHVRKMKKTTTDRRQVTLRKEEVQVHRDSD